jgi:ribosomal protein S18 acetylase RimI-like enzyme
MTHRPEDWRIAPAGNQDIQPLVKLFLLVERQHEHYWPLRWALRPDIEDRYTRWITNNCNNPDWLFVVARPKYIQDVGSTAQSSSDVIGGLAAAINQEIPIYQYTHYALIHDLAVLPAARRHGVGTALLDYARQWAAQKGVNQLRLMAAADNTAAQALFVKAGFRKTYSEMVLPVETHGNH